MEEKINNLYQIIRFPLLLLLIIAFTRFGIIPGWQKFNSDFPNYFVSAQLLQKKQLLDAYDIHKFYNHIHQINPNADGMFVMYPPPTALVMQALADFDMLTAKRIWVMVSLCMLVLIIFLFANIAQTPLIDATNIVLLSGFNLYNDIMLGQIYTMLILFLLLGISALNSNHQKTAAVSWGIVAALKFLPLFFMPILFLKKHFQLIGFLIITFLCIHLITFSVAGLDVYKAFWAAFCQNYLGGEVAGEVPLSVQYQSIQVMVNRSVAEGSLTSSLGLFIVVLWKIFWTSIAVFTCWQMRHLKYFIEIACSSVIMLLLLFENGSATYHLLFTLVVLLTVYKVKVSFKDRFLVLLAFAGMGFIPFAVHLCQFQSIITDYTRLWCLCLFAASYFYVFLTHSE